MQDATIYLCQANPFLSQLRLVPKIGQWGQLDSKEVDYTSFTIRLQRLHKYNYSTTMLDTNPQLDTR